MMKELEGKIILFHLICGYLPSIISSQEITFHLVEENKRGLILGNLNYFITSKLKTDPRITEFHVSSKYFEIDNQTKNVQMVSTIDLDTICSTDSECCDKEKCVIETKVVVQEYSQYKSSFSLKVEVKDLDDNFPLFQDEKQIIKLSEKISINTSISIDGAMDKDFSKINQKKNYQFFDESMTFQLFVYQYDPDILSIMVMRSLDYELKQIYFCKLKVCDKTYQNCVRKSIIVQVIDENDNEPMFEEKKYLVKIPESYPIGKKILKVTAKDADSSLYNKTFYGFQSNYNVKSIFNIEKESGVISLKQSLSINKKSRYLFTVYAIDALSVTFKKDYADVEIEIEDVNDNYPIISLLHGYMPDPYAIRIDENTPPKTLFSIHVSDKDTGINAVVNCSLRVRRKDLLEMIKADMEIYQIRTIRSFDYEILQLIEAEILCIDSGSPALLSRKAIKIIIVDVNEFEPSIRNNFEELSFKENIPEHKFIMSIDASDKDKGAVLRYSLDEIGRIYFTINSRTGEIITSNVTLDKEMNDSVKFKVFITDSLINPHTATVFVTVTILDQNDNAPQFVHTLPFTIQEGLSFYSKLSTRIEAKDADKDEINHSIIFRLLHTYNNKMELLHEKIFDVNSKGEIETVVTIDREKDSNYTLTILAQDKGNPPKSTSTNITITVIDVNDNSPVWVSPTSLNSSEPEARFNISKEAAIGSIVAQLKALDQDQDDFGKISYVIMSTESHYQGEQFLTLNETSGILSIHQHPLSYGRTLLKISAHDHGHPPLKNYATLIINVQQPNDNLFSGLNMAIIIGMLSITALISIFLIIAIFFIRRSPNPPRHYRHSNQNIRKECDNNLKSSYKDLVDYNDKKESVFTDSDCHHVYYRNGNLDSNLAMYSQSPVEGVCPTYVRFATPGSYLHEMDGESADSGKGTSDLDVAHQSSMKASSTNLYGSIQLIPSNRINYFVPNKPIRNSYQVINEGEQAYNLETFQQQSFSNTLHSPETIPKLCSYQTLSFNSLPPYNA